MGQFNNACAKHQRDVNHAIDWNNSEVLYKSNQLSNRLIVECTLIKSRPNFNNMASTLTIENLSAKTILKANPKLQPPD